MDGAFTSGAEPLLMHFYDNSRNFTQFECKHFNTFNTISFYITALPFYGCS